MAGERPDNNEAGEAVRLCKAVAAAGVGSRREADRMIAEGRVAVNGKVETNPATRVRPGLDELTVDGLAVGTRAFDYVLLHKPVGCVCTRTDPEGRPTIYSLLPRELEHLAYVGRLDLTTSGVLLLTNDGALNYRLTRPEFTVEKRYQAKVRGQVDDGQLAPLEAGVEDDGERLVARQARAVRQLSSNTIVEIVLTEGRNREVRRMLDRLGLKVVSLGRTAFAGLTVDGLEPGRWRRLTRREIEALWTSVAATPPEAP